MEIYQVNAKGFFNFIELIIKWMLLLITKFRWMSQKMVAID